MIFLLLGMGTNVSNVGQRARHRIPDPGTGHEGESVFLVDDGWGRCVYGLVYGDYCLGYYG